MVSLAQLWLPIVLSAIIVWLAAALLWTALPNHKNDWRGLPKEDAAADALRGVAPGQYHIPHPANRAETKTAAWQEKAKRGPMAMILVVRPGVPAMGKSLVQHLVYTLVVSLFVAYLAAHSLAAGASYLAVFRIAGTAAILAYAGYLPLAAIWFGRSWGTVVKEIVDGIIYGLLTAGVFGWLWPR